MAQPTRRHVIGSISSRISEHGAGVGLTPADVSINGSYWPAGWAARCWRC
ncbi:MAG: hypothetical protein ACLP1Q_18145 [Solirubrobacteraceae bacterium]